MNVEEGYRLAEYQRPGVKIVMGPEAAREERIAPLSWQDLSRLPGDWSWQDQDLRLRLGFVPSNWARMVADYAQALNHEVTNDEWRWLHGKASLEDARKWLRDISEEST